MRFIKPAALPAVGEWGVGNDGNDGLTKANPWATIDKFDADSGAGDTAELYGDISSPVTHTGTTVWLFTRDVTLTTETLGGAILDGPATDRVLQSTVSISLERLVIDSDGKNYGLYNQSGGNFLNKITDCTFINWQIQGVFSQCNLEYFGTNTFTTTTGSTSTIIAPYHVNATVDGGHVTVNGPMIVDMEHTAATGQVFAAGFVKSQSSAQSDLTVIVKPGTVAAVSTANAAVIVNHARYGSSGGDYCNSVDIDSLKVTSTGPSTNVSGIQIIIDVDVTVDKVHSRGHVLEHIPTMDAPSSGRAHLIGNDNNVFTHGGITITDYLCELICVIGFDHGVMLGGVLSRTITKCTEVDVSLSLVLKNCLSCFSFANLALNPTSVAMRFKSSEQCTHKLNTVYVDKDMSAINNGLIEQNNDTQADSVNNRIESNSIIVGIGGRLRKVIAVASDSVGQVSFDNNNYFAAEGWDTVLTGAGSSFSNIGGSTQATFEDYQANVETTATDTNTQPVNAPTDLRPTAGGNGGLAGSATGLSDFNNVIYPDPPPWGAYNEVSLDDSLAISKSVESSTEDSILLSIERSLTG